MIVNLILNQTRDLKSKLKQLSTVITCVECTFLKLI